LQLRTEELASLHSMTLTAVNGIDSRHSANNAFVVTSNLLSNLMKTKLSMDDVANGVLLAASSRSRMLKEMNQFIINNEDSFAVAKKNSVEDV
jgi:hypothetical protein